MNASLFERLNAPWTNLPQMNDHTHMGKRVRNALNYHNKNENRLGIKIIKVIDLYRYHTSYLGDGSFNKGLRKLRGFGLQRLTTLEGILRESGLPSLTTGAQVVEEWDVYKAVLPASEGDEISDDLTFRMLEGMLKAFNRKYDVETVREVMSITKL